VDYYRRQLRELLTDYGPVFEVWLDGANGGDGFYGGARERRTIDRRTYYGWQETWDLVRRLQPDACIFSDVGPDVRWVGNEKGIAGDPCWHTIGDHGFAPGEADAALLNSGERDGDLWRPAECDVSIRPGWFYHAAEDDRVRSPENLLDLHDRSVGRGAAMLLNLPPDRRGLIHERDAESLKAFRKRLDSRRRTARFLAAADPGNAPRAPTAAEPLPALPRDKDTLLAFTTPVTFDIADLREDIAAGQHITRFSIHVENETGWHRWGGGTAIGNRRLVKGEKTTCRRLRIALEDSAHGAALRDLSLYDTSASGPGL
jgi:alpha-L-fucosidase